MRFKFINLNIWLGGKLFDQALSFFKKENADIIALQEVYNGTDPKLPKNLRTLEAINQELDYKYSFFSPCLQDESTEGKVDRGNAILSRFPITQTDYVFYDRPYGVYSENNTKDFPFFPRTLQHAIIKINSRDINCFNTQGIWGTDGEDSQRRSDMSKIIVDNIKDKQNVILAGDFNVQPTTSAIRNIEGYLKNVFKDELKTTFNMKRKTNLGYASAVVDMIFTSKDINVIRHSCLNIDVSDHLPLVCIFEVG